MVGVNVENQDLILKLHDYEMVYAIEELSKKLQNPFSICDLNKQLEIGSMLDISVNQLIQSVLNKDLSSLRLGVIQMTVTIL